MGGVFYEKKGYQQKLPKMDIFVIRLDSNDNLVNSRPCHNCLSMMKAVNIQRVFYSVDGSIDCERVTNMISINASSVTRYLEAKEYNAPTDKTEYYKHLFLKYLPTSICSKNFKKFVKYNFSDVLPTYRWEIVSKKIIFYDNNNVFLASCDII